MSETKQHRTARNVEKFQYSVAFDFVAQLQEYLEKYDVKQSELATRAGVSEARVSKVVNDPGNLTLKTMTKFARALDIKLTVLAYDDDDPKRRRGPINSEVFRRCWDGYGRPVDLWEVEKRESEAVKVSVWRPAVALKTEQSVMVEFEGCSRLQGTAPGSRSETAQGARASSPVSHLVALGGARALLKYSSVRAP